MRGWIILLIILAVLFLLSLLRLGGIVRYGPEGLTVKLIADGVLRGAGAMTQYTIATFTDLILRVVLAFVFFERFFEIGIWMAWPVGWTIAAIMSLMFYLCGAWKKKMI